jgi:hypothetical protein
MLSRASLLSVLLGVGTILVGERTFQLWKDRPWQDKPRSIPSGASAKGEDQGDPKNAPQPSEQFSNTQIIVAKNLFDPERGANTDKDKEKEAQAIAAAMQRMRSMVLVGTIVLGDSRYAIVEDPGETHPAGPRTQSPQKGQTLRLKLGDAVEGFQLSEIGDRKIVFSKGPSRVDVAIDYFRKVEEARQPATAASPPGARPAPPAVQPSGAPVRPRIPRRDLANRRSTG